MSYQVLARKWRPRNFESLVGQEHVVKALTHALETGRLHHAYLFTGTRGVGKTTISRILAKSLNCETGITARPCGVCTACTEIDSGRYVDYIEMDAASYRGVDEMVDLLERAAYAPSSGRYKVYMIDEVHQLSNHAFNAMLKTLEEPPAHILFILATTDPQKVPVTVLSRCLQFNLKQLPASEIAAQLGRMLVAEEVKSEEGALRLIANAGRGSMRDAQSLLDQAIAYSGGEVTEAAVRAMLGTVDDSFLYAILEAISAGDAQAMLAVATDMDTRSVSFDSALQELAGLLHLVALAQTAPGALAGVAARADVARIGRLAQAFSAEDVQLNYQIAIHGRQDLPLAPDDYAGFTMALLRMLAFRPSVEGAPGPQGGVPPEGAHGPRQAAMAAAAGPAVAPRRSAAAPGENSARPVRTPAPAAPAPEAASMPRPASRKPPAFDGDWPALARQLKVSGITQQLARQSELRQFRDGVMELAIPPSARHLGEKAYLDKLVAALTEHFGMPIRIEIVVGETRGDSIQDRAVASINQDGFVREMLERFDATIVETSIQPGQETGQNSRSR
jgi:DNA polymerase-3 subunit gamma/tau